MRLGTPDELRHRAPFQYGEDQCGPACVAIALNTYLSTVVMQAEKLGMSGAMNPKDVQSLLCSFGVLTEHSFAEIYRGFLYIISVPSLNTIGKMHWIVCDARYDDDLVCYDPLAFTDANVYGAETPISSFGVALKLESLDG